MNHIARAIAALSVAGALLILILGLVGVLEAGLARAAALTVFAIGFLATGVLPEYLTAVLFFLFAMLLQVAPATVVFSGFASTAVWLIFAGLVIGAAVKRTGLGERLAQLLLARIGRSYTAVVCGAVLIPTLMAFLMPSSLSRAVLLMPVICALAEALGYREGSRGRTGIVMAAGLACFVPAGAVLPATVPNMVLIGTAESQFGVQFSYFQFLLVFLPVMTLAHGALLVGLAVRMFAEPPTGATGIERARPGPLSGEQRALLLVLAGALLGWVTDFAHGVSAAWVGLTAAALLLLPGRGLVPQKAFAAEINWSPLFYVSAVLGLAAVVSESGLAGRLEDAVLAVAPLDREQPFTSFLMLVGMSSMTGFFTTMAGIPAVLTPLAANLAEVSGLPLQSVLLTQVIGCSILFVPYQSPPLVVAMQLGGVRVAEGIGYTVVQALLAWTLLVPLHYLWWQVLGLLG